MVAGQDINTLNTANVVGSLIQLATSSTVTIQPGVYKIEMSAAFDFSDGNGYA